MLMQRLPVNTRWCSMKFLENVFRNRNWGRERRTYRSCLQNSRALNLKRPHPWSFQSKLGRMHMLRAIGTMLPVALWPVRVLMRGLIALMTR